MNLSAEFQVLFKPGFDDSINNAKLINNIHIHNILNRIAPFNA
ncbi:MAG TPA: hypothetical protein PK874_04870 [Desulfobacteraceae bacterium]|nr:hypothetical protein [Desulfobacteraceae bacterium]HPJ66534.1 hypothetical protein [Desulfobacteraceae bacterium]HPQ29502.1 hypothetical protein [Desulfobacteraceae bacterium]